MVLVVVPLSMARALVRVEMIEKTRWRHSFPVFYPRDIPTTLCNVEVADRIVLLPESPLLPSGHCSPSEGRDQPISKICLHLFSLGRELRHLHVLLLIQYSHLHSHGRQRKCPRYSYKLCLLPQGWNPQSPSRPRDHNRTTTFSSSVDLNCLIIT